MQPQQVKCVAAQSNTVGENTKMAIGVGKRRSYVVVQNGDVVER